MHGRMGGTPPEERFFRTTSKLTAATPPWLLRIERTTPHLDVKGVDALAILRYPFRARLVRIPIQIKGSVEGWERYLEEHTWAQAAHVIGMVILPEHNDEYIRQKLYWDLNALRERRFDPRKVLAALEKEPLNKKGREYKQTIVDRRPLEQSFRCYRRPKLRWTTRLAQWLS